MVQLKFTGEALAAALRDMRNESDGKITPFMKKHGIRPGHGFGRMAGVAPNTIVDRLTLPGKLVRSILNFARVAFPTLDFPNL